MAKKLKYRRINNNSYYEPEELAECTGSTVYTIYSHIRNGLQADTSKRPYLIYGRDAKNYFHQLYNKKKITKRHHDDIICNRCKKVFDIRLSKPKAIFSGRFYNPKKALVYVSGNCPHCDYKFHRLKSTIVIEGMKKGARIPIENITTREN